MEKIFLLFGTALILVTIICVQAEDEYQSGIDRHSKFQKLLFASFHRATLSETQRFDSGSQSWGNSLRKEKPCCYPKTWQGLMYRYPSTQDIEFFVTFYEDDPNRNLALDVVVTIGNSTSPTKFSQIVQMDSSGTKAFIYQFDKKAKICTRQQFDNVTYDQLTGHCVPDDAFYAGAFPMGIPKGGSSFTVRSWMWKPAPKQLPDVHYERLVSSDCAPVLGIVRGTLPGNQPILQSDYYFNIQTSISDPSVFNLPDYCKKPSRVTYIPATEDFNLYLMKTYFNKIKKTDKDSVLDSLHYFFL